MPNDEGVDKEQSLQARVAKRWNTLDRSQQIPSQLVRIVAEEYFKDPRESLTEEVTNAVSALTSKQSEALRQFLKSASPTNLTRTQVINILAIGSVLKERKFDMDG